MGIQSLGLVDPLKNGKTTPFSILGCKIPWTEELSCYTLWCCNEVNTTGLLTEQQNLLCF